MCQLTILLQNDKTFISHCPKCENVQIIRGNTAMRLTMIELESLYEFLSKMSKDPAVRASTAHYFIPLPSDVICLVLRAEEIIALHDDIKDAYGVLEFHQILFKRKRRTV